MGGNSERDPMKEVILRSWTDPAFKERLLSEPAETLAEFGIASGAAKLKIVENDEDTTYFVIPCQPELDGLSDDKIRELVDSVMFVQLVLPTILDK